MPIADCRFVPKQMKGQLSNRLQEREVSFEPGESRGRGVNYHHHHHHHYLFLRQFSFEI